ncbi:MAG: hypothetical protein M0R03_18880 [Novosphingobium sp.]|nr:hypothetical protein [Novosphingobium sp.]
MENKYKISVDTMTSEEIKLEMKNFETLHDTMKNKVLSMLDEMDLINKYYTEGEEELKKRGVL